MAEAIQLPMLIVKTGKSEFRLHCHAAAWASEYGGTLVRRRHSRDCSGLLMLSTTGPDTAVKAIRATLYQPDVEAELVLEMEETTERMVKARTDGNGKPVVYSAAVVKLAPGVVHLVATAKVPGLMPNMGDDGLWDELTGPYYSTPLLRSWIPWLRDAMVESGDIVGADCFESTVGVLKIEPDDLDALVSTGVRQGHLQMKA